MASKQDPVVAKLVRLASFGQSEACLDPGAGIFLTPLASATLSCTLGMVWNDQTLQADAKRPSNKTL